MSTSGNSNSADGRDHWPYCYTSVIGGAGIKRGYVHGKSDKTGSAPTEDPVHPTEILATVYHAMGIDPQTIVYNHLNQPRELVKAEAVERLFAYRGLASGIFSPSVPIVAENKLAFVGDFWIAVSQLNLEGRRA